MLPIFLAALDTSDEKQAFTELYETNRRLMFSVAVDILQDDGLAEDAVNQAFLRLLRHFKKIHGFTCNQTRNYLVIMVRNASIDMYNERRKIAEVPLNDSRSSDMDDAAMQMDYAELLDTMAQLPELYSEALYLSYQLGFSVKEIADSLGISASAVKLRLMRARQMLRIKLGGEPL